jgi:2-iminoacetate synthase ThiH
VICPDKLDTDAWLQTIEAAHRVGFKTTATIMFGHVDGYEHWARHLLRIVRCRCAPAALPNSFRCPSSTWKRRST